MRKILTDAERYAYAAGMLDGDGCIMIYLDSFGKYRAVIKVKNTNKDVIIWLNDNFGGSIHTNKMHNPKWKDDYDWMLYAVDDISKFITNVYPYLIIKLKQAQTLLFFLNREYNDNGERWFKEMKELNKKGKPDGSSADVREAERNTS